MDNTDMCNPDTPVTAAIVGAGHRALLYASVALDAPDRLKIVAVAEPNDERRNETARTFGIPRDHCFKSADELARHPKLADAVINGTMDRDHVRTSLPLLDAGYHMLLEKPIGISQGEVMQLLETARKFERIVMVCHVLRYAPFYTAIRRMIQDGDLGEITHVHTYEHVSYHHASVSFVRGKWNSMELCGSSMLMSKCCHDMDMLVWLKSGSRPTKVTSFGSRSFFRPEKAPAGSGTRCLVDCPIEPDCMYSARKLHIDNPERWSFYVWDALGEASLEEKIESLKTDNPQGRCVWKCDNDVVDRQSVLVEFEDGCAATHNMVAGTSKPCRGIHIIGTMGEAQGIMEDGCFTVRHPDTAPGHEYSEEIVNMDEKSDMHGGGDIRLVEDFIRVLRGERPSISSTLLTDSVYGHLVGFLADQSRTEGMVVPVPELK